MSLLKYTLSIQSLGPFGQNIMIQGTESERKRRRAHERSYGEVSPFITREAECCLEHGHRLKTL